MPSPKPKRPRKRAAGGALRSFDAVADYLATGFVFAGDEDLSRLSEKELQRLWDAYGERVIERESDRKGIRRCYGWWRFVAKVKQPQGWTKVTGDHGDPILVPSEFLFLRDNGFLTPEEQAELGLYISRRPRMLDGRPQGIDKNVIS